MQSGYDQQFAAGATSLTGRGLSSNVGQHLIDGVIPIGDTRKC